jgi:hypothetical protein
MDNMKKGEYGRKYVKNTEGPPSKIKLIKKELKMLKIVFPHSLFISYF